MKFISFFNNTPLLIAVENDNIELVQILLTQPNIDVNIKSVSNADFYIILKLKFDSIPNLKNIIKFQILISHTIINQLL